MFEQELDKSGSIEELRLKPMIGWLKGEKIDTWQQLSRKGIVLDCRGVGYEVQTLTRQLNNLNPTGLIALWVHQVQRDDACSLFGFLEKDERDLFRTLIGVSGVGPQVAMALLEESAAPELIEAIIQGDIPLLTKANGVGKRTAERLTVELRSKLPKNASSTSQFPKKTDCPTPETLSKSSLQKELHRTLSEIGYEDLEIQKAIQVASQNLRSAISSNSLDSGLSSKDFDALLKSSLLLLSQEVA